MRYLAALLLALTIGHSAAAQSQPQTLPDDSQQYSLLILHEEEGQQSAATARLYQLFRTDGALTDLARSCASFHFSPSNQIYQQRYAEALPPRDLPVLALVRPDGGVVYKASGDRIPTDAKELHANLVYYATLDQSLRTAGGQPWDSRAQCPDGNCPDDSVSPRRPWRPDGGGLRPDSWIPDSVDVNPSLSVDFGDDIGLWILIAVIVLAGACVLGLLLKLAFQD